MSFLRSITFPGIGKYDIEQEVPPGGSTGQVLKKKSAADGDVEWGSVAGGVSSVNGQTGEVELDAEDVGARDADTPIDTNDIAASAVSDVHTISFLSTDVWTQETDGASITKSASWVGANDNIIFDVLVSKTTSWGNDVKRVDAFSKLLCVTIANGSLTFSAREPFDIDLDVICLRIKR